MRYGILIGFLFLFSQPARAELNLEKLPDEQIEMVKTILIELGPVIKEKEAQKNLATLTFEELYKPLNEKEQTFLRQFQNFDPVKAGMDTHWQGLAFGNEELVAVENQKILKDGKEFIIPPQFVPPIVYSDYNKMMAAMEKDLKKRLYIESAYRSSAYQLHLFVSYLQNHNYSVRETAHWNAFPGYSEHGNPKRQAIDFINAEGINGEKNPEEFAALPEYDWLLKNADKFNFVLSYPKKDASGIGYEPWHWRHEIVQSKEKRVESKERVPSKE